MCTGEFIFLKAQEMEPHHRKPFSLILCLLYIQRFIHQNTGEFINILDYFCLIKENSEAGNLLYSIVLLGYQYILGFLWMYYFRSIFLTDVICELWMSKNEWSMLVTIRKNSNWFGLVWFVFMTYQPLLAIQSQIRHIYIKQFCFKIFSLA